ncbi:hypothetical protein NCTGTJJY_CDS0084 [Serratia phage 92A1]|nr:hypothetical protein NCTGTJJY_CDS0084 [Serratia phage 92A1]
MKTFHAIKNQAYGSLPDQISDLIVTLDDTKYMGIGLNNIEKAKSEGRYIGEVKALKGPQVTMPNGFKAKLFQVGDEVWAKFKDGYCCKYSA